jgi:hypothetical protein
MDFDIDRRKLLKATGAGLATVTVTSGTAGAQSLPGSGTEEDPYEIDDFDDLMMIDDDLTANYILTDDIEFGENVLSMPLAYDMYNSPGFTGTLDGQGHEIRNFVINSLGTYQIGGLFRRIDTGGVVKNLDIVNIDVTGDSSAGSLAGKFDGGTDGKIENVSVTGNVESLGGTGSDPPSAGGIVGTMFSGRVVDCESSATVDGGDNVGGVIGNMSGGEIARTYADGEVIGGGERSGHGGFVGLLNGGSINRCYATGVVNGSEKVGGFAGSMSGGEITQAYAWGSVESAFSSIGGFVGSFGDGTIEEVYAVGEVIAEGGGGLVGEVPTEGGGDLVDPILPPRGPTPPPTNTGAISPLQSSLDIAYWDEVSTGKTSAVGSGSLPLGSDVGGFSTDNDGDSKADEMTGDDAPDSMVGFDFDNTWVTITEDGDSIISFGVDTGTEEDGEDDGIGIAQDQEGDGYPRFGEQKDDKDCIDRRNLGRGEEDEECPFDRDVERGGSRRGLDQQTGRGGRGAHRDSSTSRRDRGRGR